MIRSEAEHREACRRFEQERDIAQKQRAALVAVGLPPEEVDHAMQPLLSFQAQLEEEIAWYDAVRRRDFPTIRNLAQVGRLLVALRIAQGLTQRELAKRLGVNESVVSRDERNEYHGVTLERAQKIIEAIGVPVATRVEEPSEAEGEKLVPA